MAQGLRQGLREGLRQGLKEGLGADELDLPTTGGGGGAVTLVSIAVTPANTSTEYAATRQYTATATWSDSSQTDVTALATWDTASHSIATVNSSGLLTPVLNGSTTISATYNSISGQTNLTITNLLVGIAVSPSPGVLYLL